MMDPLTGRGVGHRRASLKCTYCARSFARTEHLTRHERSHRNEKPFSCSYCSATFTRKDVIKRHHLRYHPTIPETVGAATGPPVPTSSQSAPVAIISPEEQVFNRSQGANPTDTASSNNGGPSPSLFMDNYILDAFLSDFDFQPPPNAEYIGDFSGIVTPSRPPGQVRDPLSWRGSLELSEQKRTQVFTEAKFVLESAGMKSIGDFPSRLTLERFLVTFFECFLDYHPFLHVPTWQTEEAHPCLLLAMLVIGAGCYKEYGTAHALYRAARHSVTMHVEIVTSSASETPLWAIQSLLILISYGTRSGEQELFRNAVSWTSALASVVRWTAAQSMHQDWEYHSPELWEDWIRDETVVRTKWAAFTTLNVLTVCFHVTPALLVHEITNLPLPCNESEWASPTMESWLKVRMGRVRSCPCLGDALAALLCPSPLQVGTVSVFGTYVLLHAILQKMWEFRQNMWLDSSDLAKYVQKFEVTLGRWHTCWEDNVESSVSPRNPHSAVTANPAALFRLAYMWTGADFSLVRAAIGSQDPETIECSFRQLVIPVSRSDLTMRIVTHAIGALSTRVKLGMALQEQRLSCFQSFEVHLFSVECCLFSCAWLKDTQDRPEAQWSSEEAERIKLVREILSEVDLPASQTQKPDAVRLVYTWALILNRRAVWKLQKIVAGSLERYADSL
ncbi:fungal-specific transcription factor domain-containing protein [Aspergillus pseudoustus]|uniref:Fungal-specific transcription factor domain-containing protein n=1 Tax=Aspergillus pseudoustus TaxID=1810923 RepID=A0ABR4JWZ0_9EURO